MLKKIPRPMPRLPSPRRNPLGSRPSIDALTPPSASSLGSRACFSRRSRAAALRAAADQFKRRAREAEAYADFCASKARVAQEAAERKATARAAALQASGRIKECIQCCLCHRSPTIASCATCGRRCCRHCLEGDFRADGGSGLFECRACVGCDWTSSESDSALPTCRVAGAGGRAALRGVDGGDDAGVGHGARL